MANGCRYIRAKIRYLLAMFWWLWPQEINDDAWQWKQYLDALERGGSPKPALPGFEEEKGYIQRQILDYFWPFESLTVLGAGCGTGRMEAWLASEGAKVVCLDHLLEAVNISRIYAQRMHSAEDFVVGDIEKMPFKEKTFNLINSGGVLEHFQNPQKALHEFFRVTRPKGVIIVSVPNLVGVNAMFGMKPLTELIYRRNRRSGYIERDFSAKKIKEIIQESGFICVDISPTLFNVFDCFPFRHLRKVLSVLGVYRFCCKFLDAFGGKFPGIAFGYSFMIALARRPER